MIETENNDILSGEIIAEDKKDFALRPQTLDAAFFLFYKRDLNFFSHTSPPSV